MTEDQSVNNYDTISSGDSSNSNNDHSNSDPTYYFKNVSLSYFTAQPLKMLTKHRKFKELCLENDNPEAHYIEGILQYFIHKNKRKGLFHLRQSSIGNYTNGTYLYGLLMLALDHFRKGKMYLDKLQGKENLSTFDLCWKRVKKSLTEIHAIMETRYYTVMVNLEPRTECHPDNMPQVCKKGYYFKRLTQFVQFAMNQD